MKFVILSCLLTAVLGLDYYEGVQAFIGLDTNDDGKLTIEEYTARQVPGMPQDKSKGSFTYYDELDGIGDDVVVLMRLEPFFNKFDANDDGKITFKEYRRIIPQIHKGIQEEIKALSKA